MSEEITYKFKGRLFDGSAIAIIEDLQKELVFQVGLAGEQAVHAMQGEFFKSPTGAYESEIHIDMPSETTNVITDDGSVYGPWLEGVGSRNQTTRFKGYHIMRLVTQMLNREVVAHMKDVVVPLYVRELNS